MISDTVAGIAVILLLTACTSIGGEALSSGDDECAIPQSALLGSWVFDIDVGETDIEELKDGTTRELSFEIVAGEKVFNSWLHSRPESMNSRWSYENCILTIAMDGEYGETYIVQSATGNTLALQPEDGSKPYIYRRVVTENVPD